MMPSKTKRVLTALRDFSATVREEIHLINNGGCCVYAAHVAEALAQIPGVKAEVVTTNSGNSVKSLDELRKRRVNMTDMYDLERNGVSFFHLATRFYIKGEAFTHDVDRTRQHGSQFGHRRWSAPYRAHQGAFTIEEALALAGNSRGWNPTFDRDQIPRLKELVREYLGPLNRPVDERFVF